MSHTTDGSEEVVEGDRSVKEKWKERAAVREAREACGLLVSLGKFAAYAPTPWIIDGDKYHMELRGSPLECAGPQAHRNVSLQMLTAVT